MGDLEKVIEEVKELLLDRNKKYGDKNLIDYGLIGIIIRLNDKVARIKEVISDPNSELTGNEIVEDALKDIAGYALNGLRLVKSGQITKLGKALEEYQIIKKS